MDNSNNHQKDKNDDNVLIMHCSMQLMCATTFSKECSAKILEFCAPEPLLLRWRRFEEMASEMGAYL